MATKTKTTKSKAKAPKATPWTQFMDMHSGGGQKLEWQYIYIEAPKKEAISVFYSKFNRNPNRVTCTCCGDDYSLTESGSLLEATAYNRGCDYGWFNKAGKEVPRDEAWVSGKGTTPGCTSKYVERKSKEKWAKPYVPFADYLKDKEVHFIYAKDIKKHERLCDVADEGYVWQD